MIAPQNADDLKWRTIESAPIDTTVLVCWAVSEGNIGQPCHAEHCVHEGYDEWRTEADPYEGGNYQEWLEPPTHWMPIPESC